MASLPSESEPDSSTNNDEASSQAMERSSLKTDNEHAGSTTLIDEQKPVDETTSDQRKSGDTRNSNVGTSFAVPEPINEEATQESEGINDIEAEEAEFGDDEEEFEEEEEPLYPEEEGEYDEQADDEEEEEDAEEGEEEEEVELIPSELNVQLKYGSLLKDNDLLGLASGVPFEEEEELEVEEEEEEEASNQRPITFIAPVREDPLHPNLQEWEKESRVWFNADPPLDYSPKDSVDNRISDDEVRDKYIGVLGDIKCVFVDLDGTIVNVGYDGVTPLPGAVEGFNLLKQVGLKVYIVVNTWLESKSKTVEMIRQLGFEIDESVVFTSSDCSKLLMKKHGLLHPFLLVADDVHEDYAGMETSDLHDFDSVVVGLPCTMIDYRLLTRAIQILTDEHPLMILNPARFDKLEYASEVIGPGVFGNVLNFATDANTFVPAKPAPGFFLEACHIAGVCPHQAVMIGDNVSVDVKGSQAAMCKSILLKTGVYKRNDESKYCTWIPDVLADDFPSAVRILLCALSKFPKPPEVDEEAVKLQATILREKDLFNRKMAAYDSSDCTRKSKACLPKLPSLIW